MESSISYQEKDENNAWLHQAVKKKLFIACTLKLFSMFVGQGFRNEVLKKKTQK